MNLKIKKNGIEITVNSVSIEHGINASIEEGIINIPYPYDESFQKDYLESNELQLFQSHDSIIKDLCDKATSLRAEMISEVISGLVKIAVIYNDNASGNSINVNVSASTGCIDIYVFNSKSQIIHRFTCQYLGVNAFSNEDGDTNPYEVEWKLKKYLELI